MRADKVTEFCLLRLFFWLFSCFFLDRIGESGLSATDQVLVTEFRFLTEFFSVSGATVRDDDRFFTLHPYNPHFLGSDGSDSMGS